MWQTRSLVLITILMLISNIDQSIRTVGARQSEGYNQPHEDLNPAITYCPTCHPARPGGQRGITTLSLLRSPLDTPTGVAMAGHGWKFSTKGTKISIFVLGKWLWGWHGRSPCRRCLLQPPTPLVPKTGIEKRDGKSHSHDQHSSKPPVTSLAATSQPVLTNSSQPWKVHGVDG